MLSQEARTLEELEMQRVEQQRTIKFFKYLSSRASALASDLQAQQIDLSDAVMQQIPAQGDKAAAAGMLKDELQQLSQLYAQQLLHEQWAQRFSAWSHQAEAAFGG